MSHKLPHINRTPGALYIHEEYALPVRITILLGQIDVATSRSFRLMSVNRALTAASDLVQPASVFLFIYYFFCESMCEQTTEKLQSLAAIRNRQLKPPITVDPRP